MIEEKYEASAALEEMPTPCTETICLDKKITEIPCIDDEKSEEESPSGGWRMVYATMRVSTLEPQYDRYS